MNRFIGLVVLLCACAIGFTSIPGCPKAAEKDKKDKDKTTTMDKAAPADKSKMDKTMPATDKSKDSSTPAPKDGKADKAKDAPPPPPPTGDKVMPPKDKDATPPKDKATDKSKAPQQSLLEVGRPTLAMSALFSEPRS